MCRASTTPEMYAGHWPAGGVLPSLTGCSDDDNRQNRASRAVDLNHARLIPAERNSNERLSISEVPEPRMSFSSLGACAINCGISVAVTVNVGQSPCSATSAGEKPLKAKVWPLVS